MPHKAFDVWAPVETETRHIKQRISPVLVIECLNNMQPLAFFAKEAQVPHVDSYGIKMAGIPVITGFQTVKFFGAFRRQVLGLSGFQTDKFLGGPTLRRWLADRGSYALMI